MSYPKGIGIIRHIPFLCPPKTVERSAKFHPPHPNQSGEARNSEAASSSSWWIIDTLRGSSRFPISLATFQTCIRDISVALLRLARNCTDASPSSSPPSFFRGRIDLGRGRFPDRSESPQSECKCAGPSSRCTLFPEVACLCWQCASNRDVEGISEGFLKLDDNFQHLNQFSSI